MDSSLQVGKVRCPQCVCERVANHILSSCLLISGSGPETGLTFFTDSLGNVISTNSPGAELWQSRGRVLSLESASLCFTDLGKLCWIFVEPDVY